MGVQELQAIQNAWNMAVSNAQRRQEMVQQAAYQQSEIQQRQQEAELRQKEFEAQQTQQEVQNKAAAAQLAMQKAQFAQSAVEAYQNTGVVPAGSSIAGLSPRNVQVPGTPETLGAVVPQQPGVTGTPSILPNVAATPPSVKKYDQVMITLPPELGGFQVPALTPQSYIQMQADRAAALEAPKTAAETARLAQEHQFRLGEIGLQKGWDDERTRMTISAENARSANEQANRLRVAMLETTGGLSEMMRDQKGGMGGLSITTGPDGAPQFNLPKGAGNIQQGINNLYTGNTTLEELEKTNPKQKQVIASLAGMSDPPVASLPPDDRKEMQNLQIAKAFSDRLFELHEIRQGGITNKIATFNSKEAQLAKDLPGMIAKMNDIKRFNAQEVENEWKGLFPSRMPWSFADTEGQKYNDFVERNIMQRAKDIVRNSGASPGQQDAILKNYGMDQLKRLNLAQKPAQTPAPSKTINIIRDPKTGQLVPLGQ